MTVLVMDKELKKKKNWDFFEVIKFETLRSRCGIEKVLFWVSIKTLIHFDEGGEKDKKIYW